MRQVIKIGNGGYYLSKSNELPPITSESARTRWSTFGHKDTVLEFLLSEQYHLCCYSEVRPDQQGFDYHIEHIENKSQSPHRTFDYKNLAASAFSSANLSSFISSQQPSQQARSVFGGHAPGKQNSVDMQRFIAPHDIDCSRFFSYLSDGRVVPSNKLNVFDTDRAQYTLDLLNLNSPYLLMLRRNWWDELDELYFKHLEDEMDVYCLAGIDLIPVNQHLSPFFSLTRQFYMAIAEDVLRQHAPLLL